MTEWTVRLEEDSLGLEEAEGIAAALQRLTGRNWRARPL